MALQYIFCKCLESLQSQYLVNDQLQLVEALVFFWNFHNELVCGVHSNMFWHRKLRSCNENKINVCLILLISSCVPLGASFLVTKHMTDHTINYNQYLIYHWNIP